MLDMTNNICVTSYNSTGFGPGAKNHVKTLLSFCDMCCIQEHFLLDSKNKKYSNTDKLRTEYGAFHDMYVVPALKDNNSVSKGRGSGGLVTMWSKKLTKYVSSEPCNNSRILATKFEFLNWSCLLINAYFPCDPGIENFDDTELINVLADIIILIENSACQNVLIAGDLNCHFERFTHFTNIVREEFEALNLDLLWQ